MSYIDAVNILADLFDHDVVDTDKSEYQRGAVEVIADLYDFPKATVEGDVARKSDELAAERHEREQLRTLLNECGVQPNEFLVTALVNWRHA